MKLARLSAGAAIVLTASLLSTQGVQAASNSSQVRNLADSTPCAKKLISAHEGYRRNADGDTIDSQVAAYNLGANLADTDVWETADLAMVEIHDEDVSHSTTGTGLITQMTIDQWGALRTTQYGEPVPTLEQSLAVPQLSQSGRQLMMETKYEFNKAQRPNALAHLVAKIQASGIDPSHVVIYSEFSYQIQTLEQLYPALITWFKPYQFVPSVADVVSYGANGVMLPANMMTAENVAPFKAAGLTVIRQRTADSIDSWNTFLATGADGLMTDSPAKMIKFCRALP